MGFWRDKFDTIGQEIAISGMRFAADKNQNPFRRVVWFLLIVASSCLMVYQLLISITYFGSYPTKVTLETDYTDFETFPAVTLCHENKFQITNVTGLSLALISALTQVYIPLPHSSDPPFSLTAFHASLQAALGPSYAQLDWEYVWGNMTRHTIVDRTQMCSFNHIQCQESWFTPVWTSRGLCFTFNKDQNFTSEQPGEENGFRFILYHSNTEEIANNDLSGGITAYFHNKTQLPLMDYGFKISGGTITFAEITHQQSTHLPAPHGTCDESKQLRYAEHYTQENCINDCMIAVISRTCSCLPIYVEKRFRDLRVCDMYDEESCVKPTTADYYSDGNVDRLACDCPNQCFVDAYIESVTSMVWANLVRAYVLANPAKFPFASPHTLDFTGVVAYYSSISRKLIITDPAYSPMQLLGDMGGALGLLLGSTFFTVIEFFDIIIWGCVEARKTRVTSPNSHKEAVSKMEKQPVPVNDSAWDFAKTKPPKKVQLNWIRSKKTIVTKANVQ